MSSTVRAAGGVVVRPDGSGGWQVAVVHRPRYDDWSLPKGKCEPDETDEAAAHRELLEETGLQARLVAELEPVRYTDRLGRAKVVRYWLMEPVGGEFVPNDEVDDLRWVAPDEAVGLLTYPRDALVVSEAVSRMVTRPDQERE